MWLELLASCYIYGFLTFARNVWGVSGRKLQKSSLCGPTFFHMMEGIFKCCKEEEIKLFVGLARKVWFQRNEVLHGGSFTHPNILVQQAMASMVEFCSTQYVDAPSNKEERNEVLTKWVAPHPSWHKLN
jgi:hypothetical protein